MKTNLRRLGSMVMAVGMMSALSLTAFGAEAIPATRLTASTVASKSSDSVPMSKVVKITKGEDLIKINMEDSTAASKISFTGDVQVISGYDVKALADGGFELTNQKTGKKLNVIKATPITQIATSKVNK